MNLQEINTKLASASPEEIVQWALNLHKKTVITTNFRPYEAAILHLVNTQMHDIPVIWCDTGYNTTFTYKHADEIIKTLHLNVKLYVPQQSVAYRTNQMGIPDVDHVDHDLFTEQVKLEPFTRAMIEHKPGVWFTNLRKGQTAFRDSIGVVSVSKDGIVKVSPFYHFSDTQLDAYLEKNNLSNELRYYDPTKVLSNRECGLHK